MLNGSLNTKIPNMKISVGPTYWINPIKDSGILMAPAENESKGMAVTAPENRSQNDDILNPILK